MLLHVGPRFCDVNIGFAFHGSWKKITAANPNPSVSQRDPWRVFCSKRALKFEKEIKRTFPNPMIHAGYNNSHLLKPCFFSTKLKVDTILFKKTSPYIYISSSHQTCWKPPPERIPIPTSTQTASIKRRPSPGPTAMSSQSLAPAPTMRKRATCCPFFRMPYLEATEGPRILRGRELTAKKHSLKTIRELYSPWK